MQASFDARSSCESKRGGHMNRILHRLLLIAVAAVVVIAPPGMARAQPWTQVGSLMCKVDPNVGFIIGGHQPMQCTFTPNLASAPPQYYDGAINTVGLDLGASAGS